MQSTINNKKQVAELFIKYLDAREFDKISTLFSDPKTSTWWMLGNESKYSHAGTRIAQDRINTMDQIAGFDEFSFIATDYIVGENDDKVVVEAKSRGLGYGNRLYTNVYVLIFRIENNKILSIREYLDNYQIEQYGFGFQQK
ncbi:hypothetical protein PPL_10458 [Heterostelium album PN500]|uniref:SnoaL-like domain-containing protein n=1 Tax=Heterostelium pallidum (strain ATCC 26659 / Pp 5 / PN500) TaxID=670386 RepID=D3BR54_HETP5|nr:hypothetical protein PPL_10458 [Heterostelium album PN500]EFA75886.1 hypothetical protein PPL_10458 [Heterostelium album PN500]|eukprot:XP_020428020.1 hypothetical protein PPL_10458 [Heterostelium album PN500]